MCCAGVCYPRMWGGTAASVSTRKRRKSAPSGRWTRLSPEPHACTSQILHTLPSQCTTLLLAVWMSEGSTDMYLEHRANAHRAISPEAQRGVGQASSIRARGGTRLGLLLASPAGTGSPQHWPLTLSSPDPCTCRLPDWVRCPPPLRSMPRHWRRVSPSLTPPPARRQATLPHTLRARLHGRERGRGSGRRGEHSRLAAHHERIALARLQAHAVALHVDRLARGLLRALHDRAEIAAHVVALAVQEPACARPRRSASAHLRTAPRATGSIRGTRGARGGRKRRRLEPTHVPVVGSAGGRVASAERHAGRTAPYTRFCSILGSGRRKVERPRTRSWG